MSESIDFGTIVLKPRISLNRALKYGGIIIVLLGIMFGIGCAAEAGPLVVFSGLCLVAVIVALVVLWLAGCPRC